jgi:predicted alpha/beta-hydrolase family hydrolase
VIPRKVAIGIEGGEPVSGLLLSPPNARAAYVFAHGAGAGMAHPFMESAAQGLGERGIATLRYQFPYMERGSKRPDTPAIAHKAVRAAAAHASGALPGVALYAGGKSFGGRMTSQAQAEAALPGVKGLAFFGFPLHAAGKPSDMRAKHLGDVRLPMLFLQGTRDALADTKLMERMTRNLGSGATIAFFEDADHSFHVPARTGHTDAEVLGQVLDRLAAWIAGHA